MAARLIRALATASVFTVILHGCGQPSAAPAASALTARGAEDRDPEKTPGDLCTEADPDFDGLRYRERIPHCRRNVSTARKRAIGRAYGIAPDRLSGYRIDHFIPLSIGGSNADSNLWPLAVAAARRKAVLEQELFNRISSGEITQQEAIEAIRAWR